jgi:peptide/nickel transport system ATP-binding protein
VIPGLQDVSLALRPGQTLGLVGESGAGISTLARCIACLELADAGLVWLDGQNLLDLWPSDLRRARRLIQLVFLGSAASLNPRFSALEIVTEPAAIAGFSSKARRELGLATMESVGLQRNDASRGCSEFSGGQRQRLASARALSLAPKVLILDESLTGLDLPIQAQLVNLLSHLQVTFSISYIFISHDFRLAAHVSDDLAVMQAGRIVEHGSADRVSKNPQHPHTRELVAAATRFELHRQIE